MLLNELQTNKDNPRFLKDEDFRKLKNKILTFPALLEKNRITYDSINENVILGGNMRFKTLNYIVDNYTAETIEDAVRKAQEQLGIDNEGLLVYSVNVFTHLIKTQEINKNWIQDAAALTEEEKKAFVVIDNVSDGRWDFDVLANSWDIDVEEWNVINFELDKEEEQLDVDDVEELESEDFKIVLNYTEEDYNFVVDILNSSSSTKEEFLYDLLQSQIAKLN